MSDVLRVGIVGCGMIAKKNRLPDIDVPDNISALYRYANGGTGVLELSWTPGEYGRRALALCLGALESSETGQWIDLPAFPGENLC